MTTNWRNPLDWRDLLFRAANTFWQAFTVVFVLPLDALDLSAWETTVAAAAAAGLSALKTFVGGLLAEYR